MQTQNIVNEPFLKKRAKWAKWIARIELAHRDFRGYWESAGYNNNADVDGPIGEVSGQLPAHSRPG